MDLQKRRKSETTKDSCYPEDIKKHIDARQLFCPMEQKYADGCGDKNRENREKILQQKNLIGNDEIIAKTEAYIENLDKLP